MEIPRQIEKYSKQGILSQSTSKKISSRKYHNPTIKKISIYTHFAQQKNPVIIQINNRTIRSTFLTVYEPIKTETYN